MSTVSYTDFETCAYGKMKHKGSTSTQVMDRAKKHAYDVEQTMLREYGVLPKDQRTLKDSKDNENR